MRWFFWLMLMTNGLIFFFGLQVDKVSPVSKSKSVPPVGQLILLSEVAENKMPANLEVSIPSYEVSTKLTEEDTSNPLPTSVIENTLTTESDESTQLPAGSGGAAKAPEMSVVLPESKKIIAVTVLAKSKSDPTFSEKSKPQIQPEDPPPKIPQAVESSPVSKKADAQPVASIAEITVGSAADADIKALSEAQEKRVVCGAVGILQKGSEGRRWLDRLERQGMSASLRREEVEKTVGYWVVIPSIDTRQQAIDIVKRLQQRGIKDIRRFVREDKKQGISLGLFGQERNAERRRKDIALIGEEVEVKPRTKTQKEYRVDYRGTSDQLERIRQVITDEKLGHQVEEYPCERVVAPKGL